MLPHEQMGIGTGERMIGIKCPKCGKELANQHSIGGHARKCQVTPEELFWAKVEKTGGPDACWPWVGVQHFRGYGACCITTYGDCRTHRVSWRYTHGPIPKGAGVLHKCDNTICVNPAHLYLGDPKQNRADCIARGRAGSRYQPIETLRHPHLSMRGKMTRDKSGHV